jgi:hypothetical protein
LARLEKVFHQQVQWTRYQYHPGQQDQRVRRRLRSQQPMICCEPCYFYGTKIIPSGASSTSSWSNISKSFELFSGGRRLDFRSADDESFTGILDSAREE